MLNINFEEREGHNNSKCLYIIICNKSLSQDYLPVCEYDKKCEHILKFIYWHICYAHSIAQNKLSILLSS